MRNMYRIIIVLFAVMFTVPHSALAHSHLESSIPSQDEVVVTELKELQLKFSTSIEPLSTFTLTSSDDQPIALSEITATGDTLTGVLDQPLANDNYTLKWKIIGADGHTIDGSYTFQVDMPVQEEPVVEPSTPEPALEQNEPDSTTDSNTNAPVETTPINNEADSTNNNMTIYAVSAIVLVAIVLVVVLRRRKR